VQCNRFCTGSGLLLLLLTSESKETTINSKTAQSDYRRVETRILQFFALTLGNSTRSTEQGMTRSARVRLALVGASTEKAEQVDDSETWSHKAACYFFSIPLRRCREAK